MAEVSNELILEILMQVEQQLDRIDRKIDEVKSEMIASREDQASMLRDFQSFGPIGSVRLGREASSFPS